MNLATRCTACGTVFRVVQDQLRVSEGWVRCGRCREVFNAVENLVDAPLSAGASAMTDAGMVTRRAVVSARSAVAPLASAPESETEPETALGPDADQRAQAVDRRDETPAAAPGTADAAEADANANANADIVIDPDERSARSDAERPATAYWPANGLADGPGDGPANGPAPTVDSAAPGAGTHTPPVATARLPSFLRQADRAARWRQPRVRAALAAAALLCAVGLAAQVAHSWRDLAAARWPATAPLLTAACQALGCTLGPPRLIDALVVESSGLLRVERSALYRLSVTLRNREAYAIAVPAVDLTLTDTRGRVLARRTLRPDDLGAAGIDGAPAGRELLLQATLQARTDTPGQVVAGYTIALFYP